MFSFFFLTEKIRRKSLQNDYFCNNLKNKISQFQDHSLKRRNIKETTNRNTTENNKMITEDEIFTLFNIFDKNKNHVLEKNEFVTGFAKLCPYFSTKTIQCLFRFCDKDHNGSLDLNEFISLIRFVEKKIYKDDPFIVLFDKCDENGDGKLNFEEFCHVNQT